MWQRKDLKERAKKAFRVNYWRTLLVTVVFMIVTAGGGIVSESLGGISAASVAVTILSTGARLPGLWSVAPTAREEGVTASAETGTDLDRIHQESELLSADQTRNLLDEDYISRYRRSYADKYRSGKYAWRYQLDSEAIRTGIFAFLLTLLVLWIILSLVIGTIKLIITIFVYGPLEVGGDRFYLDNLHGKGGVSSLGQGFDRHYMNGVKIMFLRKLFTALWGLLFVVPGVIKAYEYQMIPYLLAEYPDMPSEDAFAISRYMMDGNKLKSFVLDLSFIPWGLLGAVTLGVSNFFWTNPYIMQTRAALYEAIKDEKRPFDVISGQPEGSFPPTGQAQVPPTSSAEEDRVTPVSPTSPAEEDRVTPVSPMGQTASREAETKMEEPGETEEGNPPVHGEGLQ